LDYIIFGIGSGATLVLIGWLLRDWGPRLRDRAPSGEDVLSASEMVVRMAWARFCTTCGMAMVLCGIPVLIVTAVAALLSAGDDRGALAVLIAFAVAILLMLIWTGLYLRQFGSMGVYRPRPAKPKPADVPAPAPASTGGVVPVSATAGAEAGQSFDETAASRGGLGRFAAFLRKDAPAPEPEPPVVEFGPPPPGTVPATPAPPAGVDTQAVIDVDEETGSATDAVIAELAGSTVPDDEKRLSIDDPLVAGIDDEHLSGRTEAWDEIETHGGAASGSTAAMTVTSPGDDAASGSPDVSTEEPDARAAAMDTLRRRRLERLTRNSPEE